MSISSLPKIPLEQLNAMSSKQLAGLLVSCRVQAGLSRTETREILKLSAIQWARWEDAQNEPEMVRGWIVQLQALHVGLDVPDVDQSPAVIRDLRMQARLTKGEGADVIGVSSASAFHAYETGRMSMVPDRWAEFLRSLRSGEFRYHYKGDYRRGPRINPDFKTGLKLIGRQPRIVRIVSDPPILLASRNALHLTGHKMAELLKCTKAEYHNAEAGRKAIKMHLLDDIKLALADRLIELKAFDVKSDDAQAMNHCIDFLRATADEAAGVAYPNSARPGTNLYHLLDHPDAFTAELIHGLETAFHQLQALSILQVQGAQTLLDEVREEAIERGAVRISLG